MTALLLALVLTADAGSDAPLRAVGVRHGLLELDDGRTAIVDGGVYLSDEVARDRVADLTRLSTELATLRTAPPPSAPVGFVVAFVVGLVLGGAGVGLGVYKVCQAAPGLCR